MPTLLEKFNNVTVSAEDNIPAADKEWCKKEQDSFDEAINQLNYKLGKFEAEYQIEANACFSLSKDNERVFKAWKYRHDYEARKLNPDANYYDLYKFSSAYAIEWIMKLKENCRTDFVRSVCNYFEKKYALDLPDFYRNADDKCDYKIIIKLIAEHLGGTIDFKSGAVEQAINKFNNEFSYNHPTLSGPIIEWSRFVYFNRGGETKYPDSYEHAFNKFVSLDNLISIFEKDEVTEPYAIMYMAGKTAGEWEAPTNGEKIEGFKLFKNGKFQLKFKEAAYATQFCNRFQLIKKE